MHPAFKVLVGTLMIVLGVFSLIAFSSEVLVVLQGTIGFFLVVLGAFIVWLESDEWKLSRESQKEDSREVQQKFEPQKAVNEEETQSKTSQGPETEDGKFACPECGSEFDTQRGMNIHRAQKHK